jgi:hypothetical protein
MFSAEFIRDPYPTYRQLQAAGPIHWTPDFLGGAWLLPHYATVLTALRDLRLSSRRSDRITKQFAEEQRAELAEFNRIFARWMLFLDEPEHGTLRRPLNKGFQPRMLERLRPCIERTVDALLDAVVDAGEMDFMRDFAHPLPALVIAEMLGVDTIDQRDFIAWSDAIAAFMGNPRSTFETAQRAQRSLVAVTEYFRALLPKRRQTQGEDLISLLIRLEENGDVLTAEDLLAQCSMLLFAGHETTRNLLGNGLLTLLNHPGEWAKLKRDPSLMRNALKELLRYESPVQFISRSITQDFEWHGVSLKQGQAVVSLIGAANRDPDQFSDPDRLDITRKEGAHLAFGFGPHVCIGAAVSYLEAEIAFGAVIRKMPELHLLNHTPDWDLNFGFRGLRSLPIGFAPAADCGSSVTSEGLPNKHSYSLA